MRIRWRYMFWGWVFLSCTTLITIFTVLREVDLVSGVETLHQSFRQTLQNTDILKGINLIGGQEGWFSDHENASGYDQWILSNRRQKHHWEAKPLNREKTRHTPAWQRFFDDITQDQMYSRNAGYMPALLKELVKTEIKSVALYHGGSQLKLQVRLADGNYAMLKPMRNPRKFVYGYNEDQPFWLDIERHNAEVAAFHLDRILNFRRSPPCAGRVINMSRDIMEKTIDKELLNTFFTNGINRCFTGKCAPWFCNKDHPVCGKGEMLEVSMCQFLPNYKSDEDPVMDKPYPWSHGVREAAVWMEQNICEDLLHNPANAEGRFFLDLIEQSIFDFLIRNYDRHHFHMLRQFGTKGFVVVLDNGKGFGNPYTDDPSLLAPLAQCCIIRQSTYRYLDKLHRNKRERLSDHMRIVLSQDSITPVLTEAHLEALDRRLAIVIETVRDCIQLHGSRRVLVEHLQLPVSENTGRTET
ncbi:extracellular serine/threonine protein kinase FAM20C-like [Diadema antillarum]|uniref:extracellular serine/threonine protein kinase FAM20C-like n=1 Tax=Diadema antillarum TaxID=105358 RepID=UPI003A84679D